MRISAIVISVVSMAWLACVAVAGAVPDFIRPPFRAAMDTWLTEHPQYRLALSSDCQCDDDIAILRNGAGAAWKPQPDYQPYYAHADFDGDRRSDVAVVALAPNIDAPILVLVLLGTPDGTEPKILAIPRTGTSVSGRALFLGMAKPGSPGQRRTL